MKALLSLLLLSLILASAALASVLAQNLPPDFTLLDLRGVSHKLSDYKNSVVFLNFWASWCPPCREELPSIQKLQKIFKKERFKILAVSLDRAGKSKVQSFIKQHEYTFTVLLDQDNEIAAQYQIRSIPTTFIIGKDGKIASKIFGSRDWASAEQIKDFKKLIHD